MAQLKDFCDFSKFVNWAGGAVGCGQQPGARVRNYYNTQQRHGNHITGWTGVNKLIDLFSIICLFRATESFHQSANKLNFNNIWVLSI